MSNTAGPLASPVQAGRSRFTRRRWVWLGVLLGVAAGVGVVLGVGFGRNPSVVRSVLLNRPAPTLSGRTLAGNELNLTSYRGKVVLVNVWASWCAACRTEHPVLNAAQRRFGPAGLRVIGIDMSDKDADARAFLRETGGPVFPSVVDHNAHIAVSWGTFGVPETYVLDRTGIIREKAVGAVTPAWITGHVLPMLRSRGAK